MVLSSRWLAYYETRYYCSFIGNRFPVYKISLSLFTIADCFILDRTTAEYSSEKNGTEELGSKLKRSSSSSRVFPRVVGKIPKRGGRSGCADTYSRSRGLYCATTCAELCAVSCARSIEDPVTCPVTTIPKLFLVNRHRVISNRPGPANRTEVDRRRTTVQ
jgi:hypothetical protein